VIHRASFPRQTRTITGHMPLIDAKDTPALLEPLTELVRAAGRAILDVPRGALFVEAKGDGSPVTQADRNADLIIVEGLKRIAPGITIVSEERPAPDDALDQSFFIIDPLDGTREYVAGRDEFTVNIALVTRGVPQLGVIGWPAQQTVWRGTGGRAEKLTADGKFTAIHARKRAAGACIAMVSRSHLDPQTAAFVAKAGARHEPMGSALKFCHIAEGRADVYPRLAPTSEWDVAAGTALVVAAGGKVTAADGSALRFGKRDHKFRVDDFIAWGDGSAS
jgi:3'(2'), 5'-bisphosphate nucleotidase